MKTPDFNMQQEADYVLGMMDLYQKDGEIARILKMKGLTREQVEQVLNYIKKDGYEKRVRQAKKIIGLGFLIVFLLGALWLYLYQAGVYDYEDNAISRRGSSGIMRLILYGIIYGIIQSVYGTYRFISYSMKLKKIKTII